MKNLLSSLTFFYRYLFSKRANSVIKRVSFICFLGLVISIGSLLIIFNIMGGLGQSIKDRFLKTEPHIIIDLKKNFSNSFVQEKKNKILEALKSAKLDSGISSFYFFESVDLVVRAEKGVFAGVVARGYSTIHLKKFLRSLQGDDQAFSTGDILDETLLTDKKKQKLSAKTLHKNSLKLETVRIGNQQLFFVKQKTDRKTNLKEKKKKEIIIGLGLANELNLYETEKALLIPAENLLLPPGEPIHFESAQVSAIISTQNAIWNSNYIFYDRETFPSFRENSSYGAGFEIRLKEPEDFLLYKTTLQKKGFSVEAWPERNSSIFFALKVEKFIMSLFLSLAGVITLLAVSSLLVLLIVQKKKEMGILMAMGLPLRKIQNLFMGIGLLLCSFGMIGAWLFSLVVCLFLKYSNIPLLSQFHAESQFPIEFNFLFMFWLFVGVFLLACVMCMLSVRSQFRYSPSELLKTVK